MAAQVKTKLWLELDGGFVIGEGGLHLLRAILRHGSLAEAVRAIGWSYRHAWGYLRHAERALGVPLTSPRAGKGRQRGTVLTEHARLLLERLVEVRRRIDETLGPSGLTPGEIAARGGARRR